MIYIIFFLSGVAALVFETVWFRLAGLVFGNSVWSAALILSGFMAGLASGNYLVSRYGDYIKRALRLYAGLEIVIAVTGMSLVLFLPKLENWLSPLFRYFLEAPLLLNAIRCGIFFVLIVIPTTAMGATLPVLVKVFSERNENFGVALGRLYGWNTVGAVSGALIGEVILIRWIGVRAAGLTAGVFNLVAAFLAFQISCSIDSYGVFVQYRKQVDRVKQRLSPAGKRFLLAAFVSGGIMLALEIVWFRFLQLFINGTSLIFALMLSIVLLGIGTGGLVASWWYRVNPVAHIFLRPLVFLSGIVTALTYTQFHRIFSAAQGFGNTYTTTFLLYAGFLMLPVSMLSGVLFTFLGRAARDEIISDTKTAGIVTLMNTTGSMFGSLIAGFFLLPRLGMENSIFILAAFYGAAALVIPGIREIRGKKQIALHSASVAGFLFVMVFFPFGRMENTYFSAVDRSFSQAKRVAVREGLTETILYYRYDMMEEPLYHRLVTNRFSMSSTSIGAKRYMKLFVYLPVALNPDMKNALLISYGIGSTAKALTDTKNLEIIDIVDISKNILEMSSIVYPDHDEHPLNDSRVSVHIEDGRFFLRTTERRYDLITSEPPPPKLAGVVNLYSQEYFRLIHGQLSEGGIVSYWLPVFTLYEEEAKSIIKAFCNVFGDCSLWVGNGLNLVLLGTRNAVPPGNRESYSMQWNDPTVSPELKTLGFEVPEQLGSSFIADSVDLREFTEKSLPLTDNFPLRLSARPRPSNLYSPLYDVMLDEEGTRERYLRSAFIRKMWPEDIREKGVEYFFFQGMINNVTTLPSYRNRKNYYWEDLYRVLTGTSLKTLPEFLLGSSPSEIDIASRHAEDTKYRGRTLYLKTVRAISNRDYSEAIRLLEKYLETGAEEKRLQKYPLYLFLLCMADQKDRAEKIFRDIAPLLGNDKGFLEYGKWLDKTFGVALTY
jgi:predicted membrane-bound spermidine synthase